jgi:membrane-bound lytic murein transglycosylase F
MRISVVVAALLASAACSDPPAPPPAAATAAPPVASEDVDPAVVEVKATIAPPDRALVADKRDLPAIRAQKKLRVLVHGDPREHLPRAGGPPDDRELATVFAAKLGVEAEIVAVDRFADLFTFLEEGKGDVVAARTTVTDERKARVDFTRPTAVVAELLVARKDDAAAPKTAAELAGKDVVVRASSSYAASLAQHGAKVVPADEAHDTWRIAADVAAGKAPLTVVDSDLFAEIQAVEDRLVAKFPVAEGRVVAWAVRKDQPQLKAAADAFLTEAALTSHTEKIWSGDLDGVKERGVLRVLTRNNGLTYFLHRGQQMGFDYELMRMFAKDHGLRLELVVPPEASDLIPWLLQGKGDVIAAEMTRTPERAAQVAFSKPYLVVDQVVVQKSGDAPIVELAALKGRKVHARRSSTYWKTLETANAGVELVAVDEATETEDLLQQLADGKLPLTVADSTIVAVERAHGATIEPTLVVKQGDEIAFAVRPSSTKLLAALDAFVAKNYRGLEYNVLKKKYLEDARTAQKSANESYAATGSISPYDDLFKKYGAMYGIDWRLLAAQAYQESRFDPKAKSWVGAKGLFQVMPATGAELGFTDLEDPEQSVHAGAKYMAKLVDSFDPKIPFKHRVRMALASYNAGKGHVLDAQQLAEDRGMTRGKWFKNVEQTMLALEDPKVHRKARHGYCRGSEPVKYVSEIQSRYDNYVRIAPATP